MPELAEYITVPIPIARNGLNRDLEPTSLKGEFSPNMKNMVVEPSRIRKRLGYSLVGSNLPLQGVGMELIQYTDARGTAHQIALTTTCAYEYDTGTRQWLPLMKDTQMQDCELETEWTAGTDITRSKVTDQKEGTYSLKMLATDAIAAGAKIASTTTFDDSADLSTYGATSHVSFWFKASKAGVQITVHVKDADTDIEVLSVAATVADTWYHVTKAVTLAGITTATSLEIDTETALVADDWILVDDIRARGGFAGASTNRWSHTVVTDTTLFTNNGGDALLITNGVDGDVYYYEGHSGDYFKPSIDHASVDAVGFDYSSFGNVEEIIEFWNHFFYINYTETYQQARSLAYADLGDIDDWSGGTSGAHTLTDTIGNLMRAKKMGSDMILYSAQSITTCRYLGSPIIFMFPTFVYESGLFAAKALWDFVDMHYFIGTDQKIYGYAGGQHLFPIGDSIEESFFSELDVSNKDQIVAGLDSGRHKLYFFFPSASDSYAHHYYAVNYKRKDLPWEYGYFSHSVRDFSLFSSTHIWYCDDDEYKDLYCDEVDIWCDSSYTQSGYPVPIFLTDDGYVYMLDERTGKDGDSNIEGVYETEDVTVDMEEHFGRWIWFSFIAMSVFPDATVDVYYSTDGGDTFTLFHDSPVSLECDWAPHRIPLDVVTRKIRFRFVSSSKDLQLRDSFHAKVRILSDRD